MTNFNNAGVLIGKIVKIVKKPNFIELVLNTAAETKNACLHFVMVENKLYNQLQPLDLTQTVMVNCHLLSGFYNNKSQRVYRVLTIADQLQYL